MNANTRFWVKELEKLNGAIIERPVITPADEYDEEFFGIQVRLPNGKYKILWILTDEEGNGPGAIEIVDSQIEDMEII